MNIAKFLGTDFFVEQLRWLVLRLGKSVKLTLSLIRNEAAFALIYTLIAYILVFILIHIFNI